MPPRLLVTSRSSGDAAEKDTYFFKEYKTIGSTIVDFVFGLIFLFFFVHIVSVSSMHPAYRCSCRVYSSATVRAAMVRHRHQLHRIRRANWGSFRGKRVAYLPKRKVGPDQGNRPSFPRKCSVTTEYVALVTAHWIVTSQDVFECRCSHPACVQSAYCADNS